VEAKPEEVQEKIDESTFEKVGPRHKDLPKKKTPTVEKKKVPKTLIKEQPKPKEEEEEVVKEVEVEEKPAPQRVQTVVLIPNPYKSEEDFWSGNMINTFTSKPKKVREPKVEGEETTSVEKKESSEEEKPKKKRTEKKEYSEKKEEKKEKKSEKKESATTVEKNEVIQKTLINDTSVSWGTPSTSSATSVVDKEDFPTLNQEKKKKKKKETGVTSSENKRVDHSVVFEYENDAPDSKKVRLEENQEVSVQ
jgi:hypothetical protein